MAPHLASLTRLTLETAPSVCHRCIWWQSRGRRDVDKDRVADDEHVQQAVREVEAELGDTGRVLLRKSGTEALVRVMVEAADAESVRAYADRLAGVVQERLAL